MPEEREFNYLTDLDDAAQVWTPWALFVPYALQTCPCMNIDAYLKWKNAYDRGLVTAVELGRYQRLIDTHPASWRGWLLSL